MAKKWFALVLCLLTALALLPAVTISEDQDTLQLARVIYALAGDDSTQTKLAVGTVVMNRVESPWFSSTLSAVLNEQQQFPCGNRYDAASLEAAHAVLSGRRTLGRDALYCRRIDSGSVQWAPEKLVAVVGGLAFYSASGQYQS